MERVQLLDLQAAAEEAKAVSLPLHKQTQDCLSLHLLNPDSEMESLVCPVGEITIVPELDLEAIKAGRFQLSSAEAELTAEDLYVVIPGEEFKQAETVLDALMTSGASESEALYLMRVLGLDVLGQTAPRNLDPQAMARVAIGCSACVRARLLLFDHPFASGDPAWVERIARVIMELGEDQARAVIITGEVSVPLAYAKNKKVNIQRPHRRGSKRGASPSAQKKTSPRNKLEREASRVIRLGARNRSNKGRFITRPIAIDPQRAAKQATERVKVRADAVSEQLLKGAQDTLRLKSIEQKKIALEKSLERQSQVVRRNIRLPRKGGLESALSFFSMQSTERLSKEQKRQFLFLLFSLFLLFIFLNF